MIYEIELSTKLGAIILDFSDIIKIIDLFECILFFEYKFRLAIIFNSFEYWIIKIIKKESYNTSFSGLLNKIYSSSSKNFII